MEGKTFKAVVLDKPGGKLEVKDVEFPKLKSGQVLVKVEASPINPSDLLFLEGHYPAEKQFPCIPGFEGSGTVVQSGGGFLGWKNTSKRVAFTCKDPYYGCWGEYTVVDATMVIPIPDNVSFETGASSIVNPLTVIAMLDRVKEMKTKTVIHTAAASALGKMMVKYFTTNGVEVINVVRRKEQEETLQSIGAKYILNSTDTDFPEKLKDLSSKLQATVCFEAVGGKLTNTILANMPKDSTIFVYGALDPEPCNIGQGPLIFEGKKVEGFWLNKEIGRVSFIKQLINIGKLTNLLNTQLNTQVAKKFPHESIVEAVEFYKKNMSLGKVLITRLN